VLGDSEQGSEDVTRVRSPARSRRILAPIVALVALAIVLTGCSTTTQELARPTAPGVVTIEGPLVGNDAKLLRESWAGWEKANKITITYTGRSNFEELVGTEAGQGNAPDLAIFSQPEFILDLATRGYLQPLPTSVSSNVTNNFSAAWAAYTTASGTDYAAPLLASVNGWVFYSPHEFATLGVSIPSTWSQLLAVTKTIQAKTGEPPWCEGFSDGSASGSAGVDWIADLVLRFDGPTVYDGWIDHQIPFTDPRIEGMFDELGLILKNPSYVNGGLGDVSSIDTSTTAEVAAALEGGKCAMTHQPSSFASVLTNAQGGVPNVSAQGDYWAFPLPPPTTPEIPITGGGDFVAAFSRSTDTIKVQDFLSSLQWAKDRVSLGGAISPDLAVPASAATSPLLQAATQLLHNPSTTFRFGASDLMPSVVGEGSFLKGMVDWANGKPVAAILARINSSWPGS
jgi:alpha-glucoside transport system substrate-binding protein